MELDFLILVKKEWWMSTLSITPFPIFSTYLIPFTLKQDLI